jgi:DNA-directed RNA polymerase
MATDEVRLKPFTYSKSKFTIKVPNNKKMNTSKQIRAFMPNLIHSLDAASLALLVDLYFRDQTSEFKNIYAVHDCFAVTANNVENLMELLKLVYIKIYSDGAYLIDLDEEIKHQIKVIYGKDSFDENTLIINTSDVSNLKFPDINEVLSVKLPSVNYDVSTLKNSSYLIN